MKLFFSILFILSVGISQSQNYFFGDLHVHSNFSKDAVKSPEEVYSFAKDSTKLDFICITDHDNFGLSKEKWIQSKNLVKQYNSENKFIALLGYEYTNKEGHRLVIYPDTTGELLSASMYSLKGIKQRVKSRNGLIFIAHPDYYPYASPVNLEDFVHENGIEIVGTQSFRFEYFNNPKAPVSQLCKSSVKDWLSTNEVFSFLGNTDTHSGEPGKTGLTGVYCDNLTSEQIFQAIKARHIFATNGKKIKTKLYSDEFLMGDIVVSLQNERNICFEVNGTDTIINLELIKNGEVIFSQITNSMQANGIFHDIDSTAHCYYYLRVTQRDGGMAWTSPLYFKRASVESVMSDETNLINNFQVLPGKSEISINYTIVKSCHVKISIFDSTGRLVDIIKCENVSSGNYSLMYNSSNLINGFYMFHLDAGSNSLTSKCYIGF